MTSTQPPISADTLDPAMRLLATVGAYPTASETPTVDPVDLDKARHAGHVSDDPARLTPAGRRALARAVNLAATFHPAQPDTAGPRDDLGDPTATYPHVMIGGFYVGIFVDRTGTLRITVDSDDTEAAAWLHADDGVPLLRVTVNDCDVHDDSGTGRWDRVADVLGQTGTLNAGQVAAFIERHRDYIPAPATTRGLEKLGDALTFELGSPDAAAYLVTALADEFDISTPDKYTW